MNYYEIEAGESIANLIEEQIITQIQKIESFGMSIPKSEIFPDTRKLVISRLPYVAFIRQIDGNVWEVVDIVHTSRKLPKN